VAFSQNDLSTIERYCLYDGQRYVVQYTFDHTKPYYDWQFTHINNPHYKAEITIYAEFKGRRFYIFQLKGVYVERGCLGDIPENLVGKAIKLRNQTDRT
jgi:hypothetical protein